MKQIVEMSLDELRQAELETTRNLSVSEWQEILQEPIDKEGDGDHTKHIKKIMRRIGELGG